MQKVLLQFTGNYHYVVVMMYLWILYDDLFASIRCGIVSFYDYFCGTW